MRRRKRWRRRWYPARAATPTPCSNLSRKVRSRPRRGRCSTAAAAFPAQSSGVRCGGSGRNSTGSWMRPWWHGPRMMRPSRRLTRGRGPAASRGAPEGLARLVRPGRTRRRLWMGRTERRRRRTASSGRLSGWSVASRRRLRSGRSRPIRPVAGTVPRLPRLVRYRTTCWLLPLLRWARSPTSSHLARGPWAAAHALPSRPC
mmetsp:Transcript_22712/g.73550  ORF Transcript_22712/g.73550 Transcript_22712/m.73550 type:complete len:202 (+) Transcript_22712:1528-2133(+)